MANPLTLFRTFGEKFQSQWQDYNARQMGPQRSSAGQEGTLASQEETRALARVKTEADIARIFQVERKTAAEAAGAEMDNLDQLADWESEAYGSPEVFGLTEGSEGYEERYKFVREVAGKRRKQKNLENSLEIMDTQVKEGNLAQRRIETALQIGSPEALTDAGFDREAIEKFTKRQNVSDRAALADLQNKEVELMLDNVRLKSEQEIYDYGMMIEDDEERARYFRKEKPDEDDKIFGASMWNTLAENYADQIATEKGHVDPASGFPTPTPEDQKEALQRAAETAREIQDSGATSAVNKGEKSSQEQMLEMFRRPDRALHDPLQGEQVDRANPENILSAGGTSGQPSRQRSLAEHGGVSTEESFQDVPSGKLDETVIAHIEDIVNQGGEIPQWGLDYLASIQQK